MFGVLFRIFAFSISQTVRLSPKLRSQRPIPMPLGSQSDVAMPYTDVQPTGAFPGQSQIRMNPIGAIQCGVKEHGQWRVDGGTLPRTWEAQPRLPQRQSPPGNRFNHLLRCQRPLLSLSNAPIRNCLQQISRWATLVTAFCYLCAHLRVRPPRLTIWPVCVAITKNRSRFQRKETRP